MAHLFTTAGGENVLKKKIEYSQLKSVMNTRYGWDGWTFEQACALACTIRHSSAKRKPLSCFARGSSSLAFLIKTQSTLRCRVLWVLVGMVGLEPAHNGVKDRCLTTWLHPNVARVLYPFSAALSRLSEKVARFRKMCYNRDRTYEKGA